MSNSAGQVDDDGSRHGAASDMPEATFATVLDGFTLDSGRKRRRKHKRGADTPAELSAPAPRDAEHGPLAERAGETPWPSEEPDTVPDARPRVAAERRRLFQPDVFADDDRYDGSHDDDGDPAAMVRPYQWTGGRTRASVHLELETLVSTSEAGSEDGVLRTLEHRSVAALCRHPHAVAEVAAKLSVPLGVARVLLSDMAEQGLITVHQTVADDDTAAHLVLMERVLSGLRRL